MTFRYLALGVAAGLLICARAGNAQQTTGPVTVGMLIQPVAAPAPGNGLPLSDSAVLHGGIAVEGGYDSNVYYTDRNTVSSPILRITPSVDLTNLARNGEVPAGLFFDLRASLMYREYLSDNADVRRLRAFTPIASLNLEHNSTGALVLGFTDTFSRIQDAPYTETSTDIIIRDNNLAVAQIRWSPGGGRLQGLLRYSNMIDVFETESLKPANSMTNEGMLDLSWRWLPKTALYLQVRQGYVSYLNDRPAGGLVADQNGLAIQKSSSYPLRAVIGVRGLITEKTSISLALGYQNAFYADGYSTSGFLGSTTAAGELTVLPLFSTKITFGAHHDFQNSVIGNFFYDDGVYASLAHQTISRLVAQLWVAYDHRRYYGLPAGEPNPRVDNLLQANATADYYIRPWAYAGLSYSLLRNDSNDTLAEMLSGMPVSGANYTKHQIFARVGLTY